MHEELCIGESFMYSTTSSNVIGGLKRYALCLNDAESQGALERVEGDHSRFCSGVGRLLVK